MRLKRPSVHVARAIDRALSGEMVKTLTPAARGDGDGAPRHVKHAHKATVHRVFPFGDDLCLATGSADASIRIW